MVALLQVETSFHRGIERQCGKELGALAQVNGRIAIWLSGKFVVPAAKCVGADLLKSAAPEIAKVGSGRKRFKTAAKTVGRQNLREQLGSGSRKRKGPESGRELAYGRQTSRVFPTKSKKLISLSRKDTCTNFSH